MRWSLKTKHYSIWYITFLYIIITTIIVIIIIITIIKSIEHRSLKIFSGVQAEIMIKLSDILAVSNLLQCLALYTQGQSLRGVAIHKAGLMKVA